jgi:hypothetical protein
MRQALGIFLILLAQSTFADSLRDAFRKITPSTITVQSTGASVKANPKGQHIYAGCGAGPKCGKLLFVMLPGAHGKPGNFRKLIQTMAASGMAAVALDYQMYANSPGLIDADLECRNNDGCYGDFRRDRVLGAEHSAYVLGQEDGILNRLAKLLSKLGWTNFIEKDHLLFDNIVFAGESQGAGMAAWIGKHYRVRRVVQFSGTSDSIKGAGPRGHWTPASWTKEVGKTWSEDYFVFYNAKDPMIDRDKLVWDALGMVENPSAWDSFQGNRLFVDLKSENPECSVVCDNSTPTSADGLPQFLETWAYIGNPNFTPPQREISGKSFNENE